MNLLIKRLAKGIKPSILNEKLTHPDLARERILTADKLMKQASLLLEEANAIITGLSSNDATFGHMERAVRWVESNHNFTQPNDPSNQPSPAE